MSLARQKAVRQRLRWRVRKKIRGTAECPRLSVCFTNKHIYAQCIDDENGKTIVSTHTHAKDTRDSKLKNNVQSAAEIGKIITEKAKAAGIEKVVFDRGTRRYHGAVKALAEAARENGLNF